MTEKPTLTPERLRQLLRYEPETGELFWCERDASAFPNLRTQMWFKSRFEGREALTADNGRGYKVGNVSGFKMRAHRVAWAIYYGCWPEGEIDHINGRRGDNRIANLRDVSAAENSKNKRPPKKSKSPFPGVRLTATGNRWRATICVDGKIKSAGSYKTLEEAIAGRKAALQKYGYHPNHGHIL